MDYFGEVQRIAAFIRELFHQDPYKLSIRKFIQLGKEAILIKNYKKQLIAAAIDEKIEKITLSLVQRISAAQR